MKKQCVHTISTSLAHTFFANEVQEVIDSLNLQNVNYTIHFSTAYDSVYHSAKYSALIIYDGECIL